MTDVAARIAEVFFPQMIERRKVVRAKGGRIVYYTTAETAANIIRGRQIWMRSPATMNDYSEVEHGFTCLNAAYSSTVGAVMRGVLDECHAGIAEEITQYFDAWYPGIRAGTFITCVSEHDPSEDTTGRLSMWRAYGGNSGVALVLHGSAMIAPSQVLGAYSSPVAYMTDQAFAEEFRRRVDIISREGDFIRSLPRSQVKHAIFEMFRWAVLCTKHPGFKEELEWRIVAFPAFHALNQLISAVEVVRGVPQTVQKIVLKDYDDGTLSISLPKLLDRVIIGPCEFPSIVATALGRLMDEAGVPDAMSRVFVSDIPLRSS